MPFSEPALQRALRKQKKKLNERLVRSTLAASSAAAKAEGDISGSDDDLTVEYVFVAFVVMLCGASRLCLMLHLIDSLANPSEFACPSEPFPLCAFR